MRQREDSKMTDFSSGGSLDSNYSSGDGEKSLDSWERW